MGEVICCQKVFWKVLQCILGRRASRMQQADAQLGFISCLLAQLGGR